MKTLRLFCPCISALLLALTASLTSCGSDGPDIPEPQPIKPVDTTVLVYMVANNNLGNGCDTNDIKEMEEAAKAGHFGNGRLLVYHKSMSGRPVLKEITATGIDTLRVYGSDTLSVSIARMSQVLENTKELSPASHYGLVLWSHASGWLEDGIDDYDGPSQRSFGQDGNSKMNTTSLAVALQNINLDFIYADCCYMGSVESVYELRNSAKFFLGSPTETHVDGMPYHITLKHLFSHDYTTAGKATYDYYHANYEPTDCPLSMVVVDNSKLDALAQATKAVYEQAASSWPDDYVPQPLSLSPYYYFDMEDYVKTLAGEDSDLFAQWEEKNDAAVVYKAAETSIWGQFPLSRFGGLSTYIISPGFDPYFKSKNYDRLAWYTDVAKYLPD